MTLKEYEEWFDYYKNFIQYDTRLNISRLELLEKRWKRYNKKERNTVRKIASLCLKNYNAFYET